MKVMVIPIGVGALEDSPQKCGKETWGWELSIKRGVKTIQTTAVLRSS